MGTVCIGTIYKICTSSEIWYDNTCAVVDRSDSVDNVLKFLDTLEHNYCQKNLFSEQLSSVVMTENRWLVLSNRSKWQIWPISDIDSMDMVSHNISASTLR